LDRYLLLRPAAVGAAPAKDPAEDLVEAKVKVEAKVTVEAKALAA